MNHNQLQVLVIILVINTICSVLFCCYKCMKKERTKGLILGTFLLLCPVAGGLYLLCSELFYLLFFQKAEGLLSVDELSFHKNRVEIVLPADIQMGMNKVPIGDALLASDKSNARKIMLDVLKNDYGDFLATIAKAVEHEDSEVSHYAASAISDVISEFKNNEKVIREQYEQEWILEMVESYADYLYEFLSKNILPQSEQSIYVQRYLVIFEDAYKEQETEFILDNFEHLIALLINGNELKQAEKWIHQILRDEVEELGVFKAALNYYYTIQDRENFISVLEKLKSSEIELDSETLDMVRFIRL